MIYLSTVQEMPQSWTTEQSMTLQRWFISLLSKKCHNHRLHSNPWHSNDDLSLYCPRNAKITDYIAIHDTPTMIYLSTVQEMSQTQPTEQSMALQRWFMSLLSKKCHNHRLQNNPWHFNDGLYIYCPRNAISQTTEQSMALLRWCISLLSKKCHNHRLHNNPWHSNDDLSLYCPRNATITDYITIHDTPMMIYLSTVQEMPQSQTTEQSMALQRWFIYLLSKKCHITDYRTIHGTSTMVYLSTVQEMPQSQTT